MELKFKNKKEADEHAKKVLATLPAGWTHRSAKDVWSEELSYTVSFMNEEMNIEVQQDMGEFHIYHNLEDYTVSNKDILKGVAEVKAKIVKRAQYLLALAEKL